MLGEPLAVEFLVGGDWQPAVLLGWRHEPDGTCRVHVQAVVSGLHRTSWMQLADLRLPQTAPLVPRPLEPRTRPDLLLPGAERARRTPTPLPPLPVPRSLQPDTSRA